MPPANLKIRNQKSKQMNKCELLAPAGDFRKLKWAVEYGADAVYMGINQFSLRAFAGNFDLDQAGEALKYLHERGRKEYVTLNIYPWTSEYEPIIDCAKALEEKGADGFIVADLGVISGIIKAGIKVPIHVSTQANTTSAQTALVYADMGCGRVNLARELSFEKIAEIMERVGDRIEIEVFIHCSQCFSYSGRCAISDYLAGRSANRGACSHPCRWSYHLTEEKRDGSFMPVFEDNRGLYLFNTRDLALYDYVDRFQNIGVRSLKIEGRMKTIHYIAQVLNIYRRVLDGETVSDQEAMTLLNRISNRGYTKGFMKGYIDPEGDYKTDSANYLSDSRMVGHTEESNILQVNNNIEGGEVLELLDHNKVTKYIMPSLMKTTDGALKQEVNNSMRVVMPEGFPKYAILRRIIK